MAPALPRSLLNAIAFHASGLLVGGCAGAAFALSPAAAGVLPFGRGSPLLPALGVVFVADFGSAGGWPVPASSPLLHELTTGSRTTVPVAAASPSRNLRRVFTAGPYHGGLRRLQ